MIEGISSRLSSASPAPRPQVQSDTLVAGRSEQTRQMAIRAMEAEAYEKYAGALQFFRDSGMTATPAPASTRGVSAVVQAYHEF